MAANRADLAKEVAEGGTTMTVRERIDLLNDCDPEAEVRVMMQESWPFECEVEGIAVREEFGGEECECDRRTPRSWRRWRLTCRSGRGRTGCGEARMLSCNRLAGE